MTGHVFVVRGNIRTLACDAWLLPTDSGLHVQDSWFLESGPSELGLVGERTGAHSWVLDARQFASIQGGGRVRSAPSRPVAPRWPTSRAWLVDIGANRSAETRWYLDGVRAFADEAVPPARASAKRWKRAKPLIAVPGVGTGHGGQRDAKAPILTELLPLLAELAILHDVDFAFVARDARMFAMAQQARGSAPPPDLDAPLCVVAEGLAKLAREGKLIPFLGSGLSLPCGLPTWSGLLQELKADRRFETNTTEELALASEIEAQYADRARFRQAIADRMRQARHASLAHVLLAGIGAEGAVTTNYDCLFERALKDVDDGALSVLRHSVRDDAGRWLLKLHGCTAAPEDIIITKADYDGYEGRGALRGILQAMLVTKHVLFAGFGLRDPNFVSAADTVRRSIQRTSTLGTALLLEATNDEQAVWANEIELVQLGGKDVEVSVAARKLEILLDRVLALSDSTAAHFLDASYAAALGPDEQELAEALRGLKQRFGKVLPGSAAWDEVERMLRRLGG